MELRRRRPTDEHLGERAPFPSAAQPAHPASSSARHPDAAVRRRNRTHAARQHTRVLSGHTNRLAGLGHATRIARVHARAHRFRLRHRCSAGAPSFKTPIHCTDVSEIAWFTPMGDEMERGHWRRVYAKAVTVFLNGEALERGAEARSTRRVVLGALQCAPRTDVVPPPEAKWGESWTVVIDTRDWPIEVDGEPVSPATPSTWRRRSVVVLCRGS